MAFIYIVEHGAVIGLDGGTIEVKYPDGSVVTVPKGIVEGISVFAKAQITTACLEYCLNNNIRIGFFSTTGKYYGCLTPVYNSNADRIKNQVAASEDESFCLSMSRRIVEAKISNQLVVLRRYVKDATPETNDRVRYMKYCRRSVRTNSKATINKIVGFEGYASRLYFETISDFIEDDFAFQSRTRRPAIDPSNCMLNIGYSVLTKEIYGELENRGLNPYIGVIHKDKRNHPALASDLIEEWRPVITDSVVLSLIQGHEISIDHFSKENGICTIDKEGMKILMRKLENKMNTYSSYLSYIDKKVTFREAIWHQAERYAKAIECSDPSIYCPVVVR